MKARIKATGNIIDVEYEKHHPCSDIISYKEKDGAMYYSEELDFDLSMIDWGKEVKDAVRIANEYKDRINENVYNALINYKVEITD